jgi:hypothetical protein
MPTTDDALTALVGSLQAADGSRDSVDPFVREDLSRPENRINVAIFGLMNVPAFHDWLLDSLGFPPDAVMFPPLNTANEGGAGRPDFEVRSASGQSAIGQVEVELTKNEEQIGRFRRMFPGQRVVALWGRRSSGGDLSLEDVAEFLDKAKAWPNAQARVSALHLRKAIQDALHGARQSVGRATVTDEIWDSPLVVGLRAGVGARLEKFLPGMPALRPGEVRINTTDTGSNNMGLSVRVFSPRSGLKDRSVSILNRSGGAHTIRFSSKTWLRYYLPSHHAVIDELAQLVDRMGGDIVQDWTASVDSAVRPSSPNVSSVPMAHVEANVSDLARILVRLAERPVR